MQPELNLNTPSLMFFSNDLDRLYKDLSEKNVTVGQVVDLPTGRAFNFADNENNYFAVMERNKISYPKNRIAYFILRNLFYIRFSMLYMTRDPSNSTGNNEIT